MAVSKDSGSESEPLLSSEQMSGYVAVAADEAGEGSRAVLPPKQWQGSLLACCGSCDLVGWGSFLLSKYLPCLAFGYGPAYGALSVKP